MALRRNTAETPWQKNANADDPLDVTRRMYRQVDKLITQLEEQDVLGDGVTVPQRISALIATGRIMKMMQDLKRGNFNAGAGSAVERYAAAFQTANDSRSGATLPRSTAAFQSNSGRAEDDGEYDDHDFDA